MNDRPPDGYLGATARISSGPAPALVATGYTSEIADAALLHDGLNLADLSHVLALLDAEVVPPEAARCLLSELLDIARTPAADFPYDPAYGDAYNSRERELQRRIGAIAGWLHAGRTRREAGRLAFRLVLRRRLLDFHRAVADLIGALADLAEGHAETVWADTTYLQPAQPSTFGHYLGGFGEETLRHLDRILAAYAWINRSPSGCGGVGGSSLRSRRLDDAEALGFDAPGFHTRDIMWSVDGLSEIAMTATQAACTVDRLCEDLEIFASPAFGYVSLHPSVCRASVLLPQKQNPYALSVVRSEASVLIGRTTGLLAAQRTPSARTDNWLHGYRETSRAVESATHLAALGATIVRTLEVHVPRLQDEAGTHFTGAADLAEHILLTQNWDYRSAYELVGKAVAIAVADDRDRLADADLARAARDLGIAQPHIRDLDAITDPATIVATRDVLGGCAAPRVREHCQRLRTLSAVGDEWRGAALSAIEAAEESVLARARRASLA